MELFKYKATFTADELPQPYKKEDLLSQEIFGCEYFNWLSSWEQFHLINKYKLEDVKQTK
jgi:hypothetical protein